MRIPVMEKDCGFERISFKLRVGLVAEGIIRSLSVEICKAGLDGVEERYVLYVLGFMIKELLV